MPTGVGSAKQRAVAPSVTALRRQLELEREKSHQVDNMFKDLFSGLLEDPSGPPPAPCGKCGGQLNTFQRCDARGCDRSRTASPFAASPTSHRDAGVVHRRALLSREADTLAVAQAPQRSTAMRSPRPLSPVRQRHRDVSAPLSPAAVLGNSVMWVTTENTRYDAAHAGTGAPRSAPPADMPSQGSAASGTAGMPPLRGPGEYDSLEVSKLTSYVSASPPPAGRPNTPAQGSPVLSGDDARVSVAVPAPLSSVASSAEPAGPLSQPPSAPATQPMQYASVDEYFSAHKAQLEALRQAIREEEHLQLEEGRARNVIESIEDADRIGITSQRGEGLQRLQRPPSIPSPPRVRGRQPDVFPAKEPAARPASAPPAQDRGGKAPSLAESVVAGLRRQDSVADSDLDARSSNLRGGGPPGAQQRPLTPTGSARKLPVPGAPRAAPQGAHAAVVQQLLAGARRGRGRPSTGAVGGVAAKAGGLVPAGVKGQAPPPLKVKGSAPVIVGVGRGAVSNGSAADMGVRQVSGIYGVKSPIAAALKSPGVTGVKSPPSAHIKSPVARPPSVKSPSSNGGPGLQPTKSAHKMLLPSPMHAQRASRGAPTSVSAPAPAPTELSNADRCSLGDTLDAYEASTNATGDPKGPHSRDGDALDAYEASTNTNTYAAAEQRRPPSRGDTVDAYEVATSVGGDHRRIQSSAIDAFETGTEIAISAFETVTASVPVQEEAAPADPLMQPLNVTMPQVVEHQSAASAVSSSAVEQSRTSSRATTADDVHEKDAASAASGSAAGDAAMPATLAVASTSASAAGVVREAPPRDVKAPPPRESGLWRRSDSAVSAASAPSTLTPHEEYARQGERAYPAPLPRSGAAGNEAPSPAPRAAPQHSIPAAPDVFMTGPKLTAPAKTDPLARDAHGVPTAVHTPDRQGRSGSPWEGRPTPMPPMPPPLPVQPQRQQRLEMPADFTPVQAKRYASEWLVTERAAPPDADIEVVVEEVADPTKDYRPPPVLLPSDPQSADVAHLAVDALAPMRMLGPLLGNVFDDIVALARSDPDVVRALPSLRKYVSVRAFEQRMWQDAVTALIDGQRFKSSFLRPEDIMFRREMVQRLTRTVGQRCTFHEGGVPVVNMRGVLRGPKDCGKSTLLHLFAQDVYVPHLLDTGGWVRALLVPINMDIYLGDAIVDMSVVYCHVVQHFVEVLIAQRPALKRWGAQIASFWKKAATQLRPPTLPSTFVEEHEAAASEWTLHMSLLQASFKNDMHDEFLAAMIAVPEVFRNTMGFDRVMWLVDAPCTADTPFTSNGRAGQMPEHVTLLPHLLHAVTRPSHFCVVATNRQDVLDALPQGVVVSCQGMVSQEELAAAHPTLPSVLRCGGREYSVSVFGGCPGYLVPFIRLIESMNDADGAGAGGLRARSPASPARVETQRAVEFYGSAVENLLERLTQICWERGDGPTGDWAGL